MLLGRVWQEAGSHANTRNRADLIEKENINRPFKRMASPGEDMGFRMEPGQVQHTGAPHISDR